MTNFSLLLEVETVTGGFTSVEVKAVGVQRIYHEGIDTGARVLIYLNVEDNLCSLDADAFSTIAVSRYEDYNV